MDRVRLLEQGVKALLVQVLATRMGIPRRACCALIGASPSLVGRAIRLRRNLPVEIAERAVGLGHLIEQVDRIMRESGSADACVAGPWFASWCVRPNQALGHRRPADLLLTAGGRAVVGRLLAQMPTEAYG